jgi:hypothetical protein
LRHLTLIGCKAAVSANTAASLKSPNTNYPSYSLTPIKEARKDSNLTANNPEELAMSTQKMNKLIRKLINNQKAVG